MISEIGSKSSKPHSLKLSAAAAKNAEFREISEISENLFKVFKAFSLKISAAAAKNAEIREISDISDFIPGGQAPQTPL